MKKVSFLSLIALTAISLTTFTSCGDPTGNTDPIIDGILVDENIASDVTWETGSTYVLGGRIAVLDGATLTIEPGVVVKAQAGTGTNATALIVARGGKIMAEGSASQPIIFTTLIDEVEPGDVASPNLEPNLNGLWGGVIILGNAPISADAASMQIEGIPASDQNGLYGGDDATDNSGIFKYVSIRHGGANIGEGNEINGLTLGGVGSGTVIENIEIVSNQDDGIEWFGGTVSLKNVVVWNTGDDAIDTDQAWGGTLDNFVIINPGDECFELDGSEGSAVATHTIKNGTVFAGDAEGLADLDNKGYSDPSNSNVNMSNIYFLDVMLGQDFDDYPEELTISNIQATLPLVDTLTVADFFKAGTDVAVTLVDSAQNTVGATYSAFDGWSWARVSGAF